MKKILSSILMVVLLVLTNCSQETEEAQDLTEEQKAEIAKKREAKEKEKQADEEIEKQAKSKFIELTSKLMNLKNSEVSIRDALNSFKVTNLDYQDAESELEKMIALIFDFKLYHYEKYEIYDYFKEIESDAKETIGTLEHLLKDVDNHYNSNSNGGSNKESIKEKISKLKTKLQGLAKGASIAANGIPSTQKEVIGTIVNGDNAKPANKESVLNIATGISKILEELEFTDFVGSSGTSNAEVGKMFLSRSIKKYGSNVPKGATLNATQKAMNLAQYAAPKGLGKQILTIIKNTEKANTEGKDELTAKNPIEAAIGSARSIAENTDRAEEFANANMKKDDQILTAIFLRALAKDGAFAVQKNANTAGTINKTLAIETEAKNNITKASNIIVERTILALNKLIGKYISGVLQEIVKIAQTSPDQALKK